jgi:hypothetical protein
MAVEIEDNDLGLQIEFEGFEGIDLAFESLPRERSGIELLNVKMVAGRMVATVLVPEGKLAHFERMIRDYLDERRGRNNQALDHRLLIDTINRIRTASVSSLWTDDPTVFPRTDSEAIWWEVWLPVRGERKAILRRFQELGAAQGLRVAEGQVEFPERTVVVAFGSLAQLQGSAALLNLIAELRRAKETADFFDSLGQGEQQALLNDLLSRVHFEESSDATPHICLLDTGVNNGHSLIAPALANGDLHTVDPNWGVDDQAGHGTELAGIALFGDLTRLMRHSAQLHIRHRLESVKLLPVDGANVGNAQHHAYLTEEAVARPEITAPERRRLYSLAITSKDGRDRGRPSAWSASLDSLASDSEADGESRRLILVAAGNVTDNRAWEHYPNSNSSDGIHDPGQSWNALTVGASTNLVHISEPGAEDYQPVAAAGGISPFSTTSSTWQTHWPNKPDILVEGGNAGRDGAGAIWLQSLSLLTTHNRPVERAFTTTRATSAATAGAARMAAHLMSVYPDLTPETVRGLLVHSAEWTADMRRMYLPRRTRKADYARLIRHCGFGIPNMMRAMYSASNSLTLIAQESLHPFKRVGKADPTLRDMHLHSLPWPLRELESLGEIEVEMRVTLSYFVEPNPSARGFRSRYRYESHGLRFDVKRPGESIPEFRSRVNRAARDEEEQTASSGDDPQWLIGKQVRHRGSLHSDIWRGTAADLASRGVLCIYPAIGWWKTRPKLEQYDKSAPYSLIVSINAPETDLDLYAAVANRIASRTKVRV